MVIDQYNNLKFIQDSIDALKTQINKSLIVVTVDTVLQIRDILNQIKEFGVCIL